MPVRSANGSMRNALARRGSFCVSAGCGSTTWAVRAQDREGRQNQRRRDRNRLDRAFEASDSDGGLTLARQT